MNNCPIGPSADDLEADGKAMWQGPQPIEDHAKYRKGRPWVPLEAAIANVQFWQRRDYESGQTIATLTARLAQTEGERDALRAANKCRGEIAARLAQAITVWTKQIGYPRQFPNAEIREVVAAANAARASLADPQAGGKGGAE